MSDFHGRDPFADHSDDVTEIVGPQGPPPRYIGSDHAPLPWQHVPPPPHQPPPPHWRPPVPPPPPPPRRAHRGLIIGAIAAVVALVAAVVGLVVFIDTGGSNSAGTTTPTITTTRAPATTVRTTTSTRPSATPPPTDRRGPPASVTFGGELFYQGPAVTCTTVAGLTTITVGEGIKRVVATLTGGAPQPNVESVDLTVDGLPWSMRDEVGHGSAAALIRDDGVYFMNAGVLVHDPVDPGRIDVKTVDMQFTCP